ncbi:hypothetical protein [Stieleria varia]|nr:hypothetical protein [Stieleria varia]
METLVLQAYRSVIGAIQLACNTEEAYVAQVRKFLPAANRLDAIEHVGAEDGFGLGDLTARGRVPSVEFSSICRCLRSLMG